MDLKQELGDRVFGTSFSAQGLNKSALNPLSLIQRIIDAAVDIFKSVNVNKDDVIAASLNFYDEFVAPLDIPGIPNLIEPGIDRLLRQALEQILISALSKITGFGAA